MLAAPAAPEVLAVLAGPGTAVQRLRRVPLGSESMYCVPQGEVAAEIRQGAGLGCTLAKGSDYFAATGNRAGIGGTRPRGSSDCRFSAKWLD